MLKKFQTPISTFEKYFREADDNEDQVSVTVAPRKNRGTDYGDDSTNVRVAPRNNRGTDYSSDDEQEQEDKTQPEEQDNEPEDYSSTEPYNQDDQPQEQQEENEDGSDDQEEQNTDGPNLGDGEDDYSSSDNTSDESGDENSDEEQNDSDNSDDTQSEEDKNEALKKYHLYKRFLHLYNIIESFIEKIRNVVKSDSTQNAVIKTVTNSLTDLTENMFDFMTIRYKSASYVQVLIYFETVISIVKLNFELLRNNKINLKQ